MFGNLFAEDHSYRALTAVKVGQRADLVCSDGIYGGKVLKANENGTFVFEFDDGDEELEAKLGDLLEEEISSEDDDHGEANTAAHTPPTHTCSKEEGLPSKTRCLACVMSADYWRKLCPMLHVEDAAFQDRALGVHSHLESFQSKLKGSFDEYTRRLNADGYFSIPSTSMPWSESCVDFSELVRGVKCLMSHGWAPTFLAVYDEIWVITKYLARMMEATSGGNLLNGDMLTFYVDPSFQEDQKHDKTKAENFKNKLKGTSGAGFSPHRDRQLLDPRPTFRDSVLGHGPKYTTCWIALTNATPDNSCLYVVPRRFDPGYVEGDPLADDGSLKSPLDAVYHAGIGGGMGLGCIRAVPLDSGGIVCISHRIIHWGSIGRPAQHKGPRIAFAFSCADDDYEVPCMNRDLLPFAPASVRVSLAAGTVLRYSKRWGYPKHSLGWMLRLFKQEADQGKFKPDFCTAVRNHYWASLMQC